MVIVDSSDTVADSGDADVNGDFQTTLTSGDYKAKVTSSSNGAYKEEPFSVSGTLNTNSDGVADVTVYI